VTRANRAGLGLIAVLAIFVVLVVLIGAGDEISTRLGGIGNDVPIGGSCCDMPAAPSGEP
jgi:hypothetical protein